MTRGAGVSGRANGVTGVGRAAVTRPMGLAVAVPTDTPSNATTETTVVHHIFHGMEFMALPSSVPAAPGGTRNVIDSNYGPFLLAALAQIQRFCRFPRQVEANVTVRPLRLSVRDENA